MLDAEHDANLQGRKVRSRGTNPIRKENEIKPSEYRNPVTIGRRRRVRKRANLTIGEKVAIVHSIIVDLNTMSDVAKEYRVTVACISNLVRAAKKVPGFLRELHDKQIRKEESKDKLFKVILDMLQNDEYLSSVRFIKDQVATVHNIHIKENQLTRLMVQDFGMKYKKVKDISYTSNDDKNLILRQ